jgi:2,3-dihydroxybenzoate-AMP ligase
MIEFTHWPQDLAQRYRDRGYWQGRSLAAGMEAQAAQNPDATAIICGDRSISYARLDRAASALAGHLARTGLGHGDTALVHLPNRAEFYMVFYALMKIGVVPVNALYSHKQNELHAYAQQIQPRLLIADRDHPVFAGDDFLSELPGVEQVLFLNDTADARNLANRLQGDARPPEGAGPTPSGEVAFFQLSGGSTGTPKLIPRTHDDYDYSVRDSNRICGVTAVTRFLCALPAPHNFLMSSPGALGVFDAGGTVILAPSPEPQSCFDLIAKHGVTMAALVPSAVALWLQAAETRGAPAPLAHLLVGGASFAPATARQVPEKLGCRLQQVFGMAEGLVNYTRLDDPDEVVFTTQGRPISPDDEVKILDLDGNPVPEGAEGQLAVRGPYTFRGYYRAPEQNAKVFDAEGFYYSGDLVRRHPGGNLQVVGRVKDQINRGGEKIASEEIEHLLMRHPGVRQAALVSMADLSLGEKSCAFVVGDAALKGVALRRHLIALGIADYKLPDRFRFVDNLPLTHVGKPDKLRLRAMLAEDETDPRISQDRTTA